MIKPSKQWKVGKNARLYPVEDVSSSFFDKVMVITETWRVVSSLQFGNQTKKKAKEKSKYYQHRAL